MVPSNLNDNEKTGVLVGSGIGGLETIANTTEILNTKGVRKISPFLYLCIDKFDFRTD